MDQLAFHFINTQLTNPAWDIPMATLSSWAVWWPLALIAGAVTLYRGGFKARAMVFTALLALGLSDGLLCHTLKKMAGRVRPNNTISGVRTVDLAKANPRLLAIALPARVKISNVDTPPDRGNSFPSSHASNCFALATVIWGFYRRRGWIAFGPAALVAFSRVYVGVHWPSDVLAGCFCGVFSGLLAIKAVQYLWKKYGVRFFPAVQSIHPEILNP